jgi:heme exporter protein A
MSSTPLLEVKQLACERGLRPLFKGVGFILEAGQSLHLQGDNGTGKTSLLRILCGLSPAMAGEIFWKGQSIEHQLLSSNQEFQSELLYLGHSLALKEELSALENLLFDAALSARDLTRAQAMDALDRQGLAGRHHLPVRVLSQGQKRRVAMARLRPGQASLWLLDEPFVALDHQAIERLRELLNEHLNLGGAILFTSHQPIQINPQGRFYRLNA